MTTATTTSENRYNRSLLFRMAHAMREAYGDFSLALAQAWHVLRTLRAMREAPQPLTFLSKAGTLCNRLGFKPSGAYYTPKPTKSGKPRKAPAANVISYFDVEANAYRSFRAELLY